MGFVVLSANTEQLHRGDTPRLHHTAPRQGHRHAARGHPPCHRAAAQAAGTGGLQGQLAPQGRPQCKPSRASSELAKMGWGWGCAGVGVCGEGVTTHCWCFFCCVTLICPSCIRVFPEEHMAQDKLWFFPFNFFFFY